MTESHTRVPHANQLQLRLIVPGSAQRFLRRTRGLFNGKLFILHVLVIGSAIIALEIVLLLGTPAYLFQYEPKNLPDFRRAEHDIRSPALDRPATRKETVPRALP